MNSKPTSAELQRVAIQSLAEAGGASISRAVWGEWVPTLLLLLGTWTLCARVLLPRVTWDSWPWGIALGLGCFAQGVWIVRLFTIQHDAGHGGLSPSAPLNQFIGHCCSVFCFTPMLHWSRLHAYHHASAGNLEEQDGLGDIYTLTVEQYQALPAGKKLFYRMMRHRALYFLVSPTVMFYFIYRFPLIHFPLSPIIRKPRAAELINILALNVAYGLIGWWVWAHWATAKPWVITYALAMWVASTIGVLLFYTQHHFENSYFAHNEDWSFFESSMKGSMTLRLPAVWMEWAIGYINYHSIHHLKPTVPLYRLRECYRRLRELGIEMSECRLRDVWGMFDRSLWDERHQRMISFAELESAS